MAARQRKSEGPVGGAQRSGHELLDHTADVVLRAWGVRMEDVFEQAAVGMLALLYDPSTVEPHARQALLVEAPDRELLLAAWLNELLYLVEGRRFVVGQLTIRQLSDTQVRATAAGEAFDRRRHEVRSFVKAATLHALSLRLTAQGWEGRVLLDV